MTQNKNQTVSEIYKNLMEILTNTKEAPDFDKLIDAISEPISYWKDSLVLALGEKLEKWEEVHGKDDPSLYTLGLRHAIVLIDDHDPVYDPEN